MRDEILLLFSFWPFLFVFTHLIADPGPRPNIVMILVDDLGWQDVGCYDLDSSCPMETPNIDALAKKRRSFFIKAIHQLQLVPHTMCDHDGVTLRSHKTHKLLAATLQLRTINLHMLLWILGIAVECLFQM